MGFLHHIGTFLLFAAAILLMVASISSPVINSISMMEVKYSGSHVNFGTFGYCILGSGDDVCSKSVIGYNPLNLLKSLHTADYSNSGTKTAHALTNVMVLHPVGAGLAFIAFLTGLGSAFIGSLFASAFAFLAWLVTLVAMVCDFVAWGIVRNQVNDHTSSTDGAHAKWGVAIWLVLAAFVALFFGMILVLFACCSSRRKNKATNGGRRGMAEHKEPGYVDGANMSGGAGGYQKKSFFGKKQRSARY